MQSLDPTNALEPPHRGKDLPDSMRVKVPAESLGLERRAPFGPEQKPLGGKPEAPGFLPGPFDCFPRQSRGLAFPHFARHAGQKVSAFLLDHVENAVAPKRRRTFVLDPSL